MSQARILVVEDDVIVARDICVQLEHLAYEVAAQAHVGEAAILLAGQLRPDLVLMDIGLGASMDGITTARAIRTQYGLPIVFLTAFAADEILERASLAEPYGYILKPFSERELRTVLKMALYKHQADVSARFLALHNQAILDNMVHGVVTLNAQGLVQSCNRGASAIFGYAAHEMLGHNVSMLMPEPVRARHDGYLAHDQASKLDRVVCSQLETEGQRKDGTVFPLSLTVSRISCAGQSVYIGILGDLSQLRQDEERIHHLAFYDELTGLPNRRRLMDRLRLAITASNRSGQHGALIFLDLDHFRQINESLGPGFGDDLLCEVARRLQQCVRADDTVAHFGGDEFMVMLEGLSLNGQLAATHAESVADKILHALHQPCDLRGRTYISSASVGIVMFDKAAQALDELLKMADAAMYQAKRAGRNTACFFDPAMQAQALARTALEKDIRRGLACGEFVLHYQVQVDARGVVLGAEALVRWLHPVRGLVPPGLFIGLAEETGLILQLGQSVLQQACLQLRQWASQPETAGWSMAVNVSSLQFAQDDFVDCVTEAIGQSGINPARLKLELTESMLVSDVQDVIAKMRSLKALGVSFSLDDFGTGYSSLSYLKRLPMDQLKIDQSFVRDLQTDPDDAVISQAIVSLGHSLGMQVIAEGVETAGQRDYLVGIGCDAFQGYFFGRPAAAADFLQYFMQNRVLALDQ